MKTPEEWNDIYRQICFNNPAVSSQLIPNPQNLAFIAAIQQDARRQGYTEAAEIIAKNWNGNPSNYCDLIEAARDNLTTP